jgi:hypothetical protein
MGKKQKNLVIARLILAFHLFIILHYIIGTVIAFYYRWYAWVQLVNVTGTLIIHGIWHSCPFTEWERKYLKKSGIDPYNGTLYQYYFFK